jgi:hypothetical protein
MIFMLLWAYNPFLVGVVVMVQIYNVIFNYKIIFYKNI